MVIGCVTIEKYAEKIFAYAIIPMYNENIFENTYVLLRPIPLIGYSFYISYMTMNTDIDSESNRMKNGALCTIDFEDRNTARSLYATVRPII